MTTEERLAIALDALYRYAWHSSTCPIAKGVYTDCDCGFLDAYCDAFGIPAEGDEITAPPGKAIG